MNDNEKIIIDIKELYATADPSKIRRLIAKHFIPSDSEKKQNAEIPTPVKLVDEMLNTIPAEFWKTPKRVFEPCCGKGNFVLGIFDKFYNALDNKKPSEKCKVIIEQCLYYADITELNVFITTEILKCHIQKSSEDIKTEEDMKEYMKNIKFNSYVGDTLELDINDVWGIEGFDAVIGNPPFQPQSNDKKGGSSLWTKFVSSAIEKWLNKNGYLLFVHPALWRKPDNKMHDIMFSKQIHYLSIHNISEGKKIFGVGTRYDYYLLENTRADKKKKTHVVFEDEPYDISITKKLPFIPNFGWSIFKKVLNKLDNNGIMVIGDSDCHTSRKYVSKTKKPGFDYVLLNSISRTKGTTYAYSSRPHKAQAEKKVLFSNGGTIVPFYDNGKLGVTQGGLYVIVKDDKEGKRMVDYLNTKLIIYLIKAVKWSNFETNKQLFWYIPLPTDIEDITNDNVNEYFGLTQEEIDIINT